MKNATEEVLYELELHMAGATDEPRKLEILASHDNAGVRQSVAGNNSTHPETLVMLARDPNANVRMSASATLMNKRFRDYAANLAEEPTTPWDVLRIMATSKDESLSYSAASNSSLDPETLTELSKIDDEVRWAVAENPSTPVPALREMAEDGDLIIWQGLVQNPSTPKDVVQSLMERALKNEDGQSKLISKFAKHRLDTGHAVENGYNITCPATGEICPMSEEG